ncbi:MAG: hypothetical protein KIT72_12220 [Polyangiaceae bacterium]|nr:hypothetical protein [Polyangiaceae bacterium]MCW5791179.1 hypothetical protein [Polyangiaceae bacterium]
MLTPHGRSELGRTLLVAAGLYALLAAITWLTDEADASWSARAARIGALGPIAAASATALAVLGSSRRGETRALAALGLSARQIHVGACLAGWLTGALGLLLVLSPLSDASALFPHVARHGGWLLTEAGLTDPSGASWSVAQGLTPSAVRAAPSATPNPLIPSLLLLGPSALLLPPWVISHSATRRRVWGFACLALSAWLCLSLAHAVAAERLPSACLLLGVAPLVIDLLLTARAPREKSP